jgi:hypothetical protein
MQYVTVQASGFVNAAAFGGIGANPLGGVAEVKLRITDYQDKQMRRRLNVAPTTVLPGNTFLVFTGSQGGGMLFGNEFRVSELAASRHWAMMGFDTLNRAIQGSLVTVRQSDQGNDYVVEVKFNSQDTVRYWINMQTFLIDKISTRYNSQVLIEEERSDYRRADCMMLPFHIVTRLNGQRFADLNIEAYDLKTAVASLNSLTTRIADLNGKTVATINDLIWRGRWHLNRLTRADSVDNWRICTVQRKARDRREWYDRRGAQGFSRERECLVRGRRPAVQHLQPDEARERLRNQL